MVNEMLGNKKTQCAECKAKFNHRSFKRVKKFESILEVFKSFRDENSLCTQIPTSFPVFDPIAAKERLLKMQAEA